MDNAQYFQSDTSVHANSLNLPYAISDRDSLQTVL